MCAAAQKVLETAISRVNPRLSRGVKYIENESKWDVGVGGRFAHELMFEIVMDTDGIHKLVLSVKLDDIRLYSHIPTTLFCTSCSIIMYIINIYKYKY